VGEVGIEPGSIEH